MQARLERLHADGVTQASLYGADPNGPLGGLNSFYLLVDEPEVYGLPRNPQLPSRNVMRGGVFSTAGAIVLAVLGMIGLRKRRMEDIAATAPPPPPGPERTTE